MSAPTQKILFGPPGCGKSYKVRKDAEGLDIDDPRSNPNMIETTFHPEYGYGDFVAKLMPMTEDKSIQYRIHAGPLIKALARAYTNRDKNVLLAIDEINRGNCAQIFGDIFQLLDRNDDGWSEYGIDPSDLIATALAEALNTPTEKLHELHAQVNANGTFKLRLPPNLSIIGTMNTSDESVYYMDTAFKRRWDFEHMPWRGAQEDSPQLIRQKNARVAGVAGGTLTLDDFLTELNAFIEDSNKDRRSIDDKLVGMWFLKSTPALKETPMIGDLKKLFNGIVGKCKKEDWLSTANGICEGFDIESLTFRGYEYVDAVSVGKSFLQFIGHIAARHHDLYNCPVIADFKLVLEIFKDKASYQEWVDAFNDYKVKHNELGDLDFEKIVLLKVIRNEGADEQRPDLVCMGSFFLAVLDVYLKKYPDSDLCIIPDKSISNKLMFFIWDNVFSRDREPLCALLRKADPKMKDLRTFGDFSKQVDTFIKAVMGDYKGADCAAEQ